MRVLTILFVVIVFCGCLGGGNSPSAKEGPVQSDSQIDAAQARFLFELKCSVCHPLSRPESKRKSYDDWLSTVHRMQENGAVVSDEEALAIAAYLAKTYGEESGQ